MYDKKYIVLSDVSKMVGEKLMTENLGQFEVLEQAVGFVMKQGLIGLKIYKEIQWKVEEK